MPDRSPRPVRAVVKWTDGKTGKPKRAAIRIKKGEDGFDMPKGLLVRRGDAVTVEVWWG